MSQKSIVCPYCFNRFMENEVLFRANTGWTGDELDTMANTGFDMNGRPIDAAELERRRLFKRYDDENSFSANKKLDDELIRFWEHRGGASGYALADPQWDMPHIDPKDPSYDQMINATDKTGEDGMIRDRDGFVTRVLDAYTSVPTVPMSRLCRYCHNPLPLPDYGKYPVLFISVVGITSSGKTVYLKQLLSHFATSIQHSGYHMGTVNLNEANDSIARSKPLPGSTDTQTMRRPMAVSLIKDGSSTQGVTIVFYDIAGENCVAAVRSDGSVDENSAIGHFIAHSDALLLLVDPEQIPLFAVNANDAVQEVQEVVDVVTHIRAGLNPGHPNWDGIPVAVVLTKSDELAGKLPSDHLIFRDIDYKLADGKRYFTGFMLKEFREVNGELTRQFARNAPTLAASIRTFDSHAFFAVSALTGGVESRIEKYQNVYSLDSDSEKKFRMLRGWVNGWNDRNAEERRYYPPCQVRKKNGEQISFPYETTIEPGCGKDIETEISAVTNQFGSVVSINLTLDDVAFDLDMLGYPVGEPTPRRVEEPILWILWRKRYIGPYFQHSEEPTRRLLEPWKKFEQRWNDWRTEDIQAEKVFYAGLSGNREGE